MAKYRKKSNVGKVIVILLLVAIIIAGALCCGYASRTDKGWYTNPDLSTWRWNDPAPEEDGGNNGEEPKEPAAPEGGGEEVHPNENPTDEKTSAGYNAVLERKASAVKAASESGISPPDYGSDPVYQNSAEHSLTVGDYSFNFNNWRNASASYNSDKYNYSLNFGCLVGGNKSTEYFLGGFTVKFYLSETKEDFIQLKVTTRDRIQEVQTGLKPTNITRFVYFDCIYDFASYINGNDAEVYSTTVSTIMGMVGNLYSEKSINQAFGLLFTADGVEITINNKAENNADLKAAFSTIPYSMELVEYSNKNYSADEKFNVNESFELYEQAQVPLPEPPVKEGYNFVGWYYDEEFTQPYNGEPIYEDTQLYAKFEIKTFTVTFDTDGGSEIEPITVEWNNYLDADSYVPIKEGYNFTGWYKSDGNRYSKDPITSDTRLTAHWDIKQYEIVFISNGGNEIAAITVNHGETCTPETPVKEGYTFKGWYEDEAFTEPYDSTAAITEPKTLYAKWELNRYTVTFDTAGGNEIAEITVEHGETFTPGTPEKTGYNFLGWYLNGAEYEQAPVTSDITLMAQWKIKVFTVTFYVDGEVYTTAEVEYGTKLVTLMTETASLMNMKITSLNAGTVTGNFSEMAVTEDLDVTAVEMTGMDKFLNVLKNNVWWIVGGAGGVIVLAGIIVAVVCANKPKKVTAGAKKPQKRGRK